MAEATAYEQYLLELINRARANPAAEAARYGIGLNDGLAAGTISTAAKQPLAFHPALIDAARGHGAWMLATDTFSHTGANGSSPGDRMAAAGYQFTGSWTWGENISIRWGSGAAITAGTVELMHEGLFESPGHRTNILNANYREIGTGLASGEYRGSNGVTATENFAKSGSAVFLLGVAFDDGDGDRFYDPGEGLGGLSVQIRANATGATWQTGTGAAGGYQLALPTGDYQVTFSGAGLAAPVTKTVTVGTQNVKLDLDADAATTTPPPPTGGIVTSGTASAETLSGGTGHDSLSGLGGNDALYGSAGNDTLAGGSGADRLQGNSGADRLIGGSGADTVTGGLDPDVFVFTAMGDRGDRITDFDAAGGDRIDLSAILGAAPGDTYAELAASGHVRLVQVSGAVQLQVDASGGGDFYQVLAMLEGKTLATVGGDFLIA